jgi:hypothetical protein
MDWSMNVFDDALFPIEFRPSTDCCIIAAAVGGVASLAGAGISALGATTAANDQVKAQQAAIAAQQGMFNTTQQNLHPFIQAGTDAIPQLQAYLNSPNNGFANASALNNTSDPNSALSKLLGLTTPGANQTDLLSKTPGFQFASDWGTKAADNSLAARGLAGPGGSLAKAVSDYNNGLASTQWSNIVGALQGTLNSGTTNNLNAFTAGAAPIQGLINTGANAAGGLATNATATGQGIASSTTGIGNAQAGAATSIGNSFGSAVGGIGSNVSNQNILSMLAGQGGLFGNNFSQSQIQGFGSQPASSLTDAQANAYGKAYGLD